MPAPYPLEFRREAVELLKRSGKSVPVLASELGVSPQSLRNWARQIDIDQGRAAGLSSDEREELRRLRRENRILTEEREILKKAGGLLRQGQRGPVTVFGFIAAKRAEHSVKTMCRVLGVSRSGFHAWAKREPSPRALEDERLTERIAEIHRLNRKVYGSPRIHAELRLGDGIRVGRKRVERLMRQAGISGMVARKRGSTTIRVPGVRVCEDLVDRAFLASGPDRLWVADITYLRTWEGWLYLVAVQDVYSRRIVGWSMADHMRTELVTDALQMALAQRRPAPGLIWHSDQGSQFVSLAFGQQARAAGIAQSMGSRGDCFDNAVAESFFATLKKELIHGRSWPSKAELRTEVFEYIEVFFNRRRRHSTLGFLSPEQFETITHHHQIEDLQPA
ncbi:MAG TPA: IS3 family transposase [Sphingomicrobium sp.]|nr:IS3 family transposase [Sphingomicrobium sp.]